MARVAFYLRVSALHQSIDRQRDDLHRWAQRSGHEVVAIFEDQGISGAKGRDKRPEFDRMLKAAVRREFDILAAWSVDRLSRSLQHLVTSLDELRQSGVGLFLHQQAIDTTTPAGLAMFQMLGVFAEFERTMIRERVQSGVNRAKAKGIRFGRPPVSSETEQRIIELRREGRGMLWIGRKLGVGTGTVQRVLSEAVSRGADDRDAVG